MFWGVGSNPTTGPLLHVFPHNLSPVSIKKRKRKLWPNCGCWDFCRPTDGETHRAADRSFQQLFLELLTPISHIICQICQCGTNYLRSDVQLWREHLPSSPLNQSINVSHVALEHIRGLSPIKSFVFRDCLVFIPLTHISFDWWTPTSIKNTQTKQIHMFHCVWIWWVHFSVTTQVDQLLCLWEIFFWLVNYWWSTAVGFASIEKTNNALAKSKCSSIKQRKQRGS